MFLSANQKGSKQLGTAGICGLLTFCTLLLAWIVGFSIRLFSVIRFESVIHEFDPWFNYRATKQMVENSFSSFYNWFDSTAWYPLGRIVGGTVYPGLMLTSAPGYISRSTSGSYDNEGIAIFALMFTFYLWIKSLKLGSILWSVGCAISYFYMVSAWGGYVFIINLIPLHVFVLLIMDRYSQRLYVAYTTFFILGLVMSMQIPFVGFQPLRTSEHMASIGVFALLQAVACLKYLQNRIPSSEIKRLFTVTAVGFAGVVFLAVVGLTYAGVIAPWSGRFYSLWDTTYAKIHIPIISSVSEHQPTSWCSFFFDLHVLLVAFPAGVWLCFTNLTDERVFVVLYAVFASYFAGVMVRLMLTLTPIVCVFAAIAFSRMFEVFLNDKDSEGNSEVTYPKNSPETPKEKQLYDKPAKSSRQASKSNSSTSGNSNNGTLGQSNYRSLTGILVIFILYLFVSHCVWVSSYAYSSPSIVLASYGKDGTRFILDDFREAYYWLWQNTKEDARIMSWWDYGYQIAGMANRTTLVDNNTWNNSHIALVGKAMASNESEAYKTIQSLDVDYVLVIFGGYIGYSGDDINKFLWMVRIGGGEHPDEIQESNYLTKDGDYRVDNAGSETMFNSLMYKLSYYRFAEVRMDMHRPTGFDRTRNVEIGRKNIKLEYMEEAFTSQHWLVRIYRVKPPQHIPQLKRTRRRIQTTQSTKMMNNMRGSLKSQSRIVRGKRV